MQQIVTGEALEKIVVPLRQGSVGGVMSSEKKYEDAPADIAEAIEQAEAIPDFLPPPDQLVLPESPDHLRFAISASSVKRQG